MKKLGKAIELEGNKLILKTDKAIKKGDKVYDESNRFIGNVIDFKGKDKKNYAIVSSKKDPGQMLGEKLYG